MPGTSRWSSAEVDQCHERLVVAAERSADAWEVDVDVDDVERRKSALDPAERHARSNPADPSEAVDSDPHGLPLRLGGSPQPATACIRPEQISG